MKKKKKIQTESGLNLLLDRVSPYTLSESELTSLRGLTNTPHSSEMQILLDTIDGSIHAGLIPAPEKALVVFRAFNKKKLVGWLILEPWKNIKKGGINVFVDPAFRRQGIGTALVTWAQEERPLLFGEAWSIPSYAFFDKLNVTNPNE